VAVDGIRLPIRPDRVYYLLYKPVGVISSARDPQGRPTVVDLVPGGTRVFPVGRLDVDSEGLLVMTNDGDLTHLLTHPRFGVRKTYVARVTGHPDRGALRRLERGVDLEDGPAAAVASRLVGRRHEEALVEIVMVEGRKREVRRMLRAVGLEVSRLVRTAIGPVRDDRLRAGEWRELGGDEVRALYGAASGSWDDDPEPTEGDEWQSTGP
jgi:23S rRNA pseudouridine2605 synthase